MSIAIRCYEYNNECTNATILIRTLMKWSIIQKKCMEH